MRLRYKAVTKDNRIIRGLIEAKDPGEAVVYLRNKDLIPINISPEGSSDLSKIFPFLNRVKNQTLYFLPDSFHPCLIRDLLLSNRLRYSRSSWVVRRCLKLSVILFRRSKKARTSPMAFLNIPMFLVKYIFLSKSAEASGLLDQAALRMAENLEKQAKLRNTIKAALTYPVIVITLMIGVVFVMMTVVIPQLTTLYESLDVELPLPTKIVIGLSSFMVTFWPFIIVGVCLSIFLFHRWHKTEVGMMIMDNFTLKIPIFGNLIRKVLLTEFARTLSLLIGSGTLVVDALMQTSNTLGNIHYKNAVEDVAKKVENGITIGDGLSTYVLFPALLVQLTKIGEQTGKLDETLLKASEYFGR